VLDGTGLGIPAVTLVDMASDGAALSILRLNGETPGSHAGAELQPGDFNADGFLDLAVGAPGAPSDPDPLDFTGMAFSETGRGHVLFGPELRVADVTPIVSHFEGPTVSMSIYNLDDATGLDILVDGVSATLGSVTTGTVGTLVFEPPVPAVPGATVALSVELPGLSVPLPDALTYTALAIDTGPFPNPTVPGATLAFTGQAFSTMSDMSVTIGGLPATILAVDPLAGDLSVTAPTGLPPFVDQDISIVSSNGSVLLNDAISYEPFVISSISPLTGPQDAGVFDALAAPFKGQPDVPITLTMTTTNGVIPPETTVEFGSDATLWREAEVVSMVGDQLVVNLPHFYLFAESLVDVRVTTNDHQQVLDDFFTYEESDFEEFFGASDSSCSTPPRFLGAGELIPNNNLIFIVEYPTSTTTLAILIGFAPLTPPMSLSGKCGKLGLVVDPSTFFFNPPPGGTFTLPLVTDSGLAALLGVSIYLQAAAKTVQGASVVVTFSEVLSATVDD